MAVEKINERLQKAFDAPVLGDLSNMKLNIVNKDGNIIKETKILATTPFFIAFELQDIIVTVWFSDIFENIKESHYRIITEPKKNNAGLIITGIQLGYDFIVKRSVQPLQIDKDLNCDCKNCIAEDCENRNEPYEDLEEVEEGIDMGIGITKEFLKELVDIFEKGGKPKSHMTGVKLHAFSPKDFNR